MTKKEIEKKRKELTNILIEADARPRLEKLAQLAKEVGASFTRMGQPPIVSTDLIPLVQNLIMETEVLTHDIGKE
jgi:hypothetical protein